MNELYLAHTEFIERDAPEIRAFAQNAVGDAATPREKAVKLFFAVRDGIYYDPYRIDPRREAFRATTVLRQGYGYCVTKAVLLAALLRSQGIACRIHLADVRNHLTTKRLKEMMKTDIFYNHGYNDVLLDGRWLKVTPTFNLSLCEKFKVKPLDWDGQSDAVLHPFDMEGRRHMEYINDRGSFDDLPFDFLIETFITRYSGSIESFANQAAKTGQFEAEAEDEAGKLSANQTRPK